MRIAITGGTGFVGRNIARRLMDAGHSVVLLARGHNRTDVEIRQADGVHFHPCGLDDVDSLTHSFAGCDAVAHCAGINREIAGQTYGNVHVVGTQNVVEAAKRVGVRRILLISFLRARPNCGSGYHESKWEAEEIVRGSGLDFTVLKCGVIYGHGDHMLDHLSHAFHTFPVFAFAGYRDKPIRPTAVSDIARIAEASLVKGRLAGETVFVVGPEQLTLREAVRRVAKVVGRQPAMFPMPVWFHYMLGWCVERVMHVPLVSVAQVRMLSEGLDTPCGACGALPRDLAPGVPFTEQNIREGLPAPEPFGLHDLRCFQPPAAFAEATCALRGATEPH